MENQNPETTRGIAATSSKKKNEISLCCCDNNNDDYRRYYHNKQANLIDLKVVMELGYAEQSEMSRIH